MVVHMVDDIVTTFLEMGLEEGRREQRGGGV